MHRFHSPERPRRGQGAAIGLVAVLLALTVLSVWAQRPPRGVPASAAPTEFSSERAWRHLEAIAREPRPMYSDAHAEVRDYLAGQLDDLGLHVEIQRATVTSHRFGNSGAIENVLGRLDGSADTGAIMLVAHYDSVPAGPGASDNGVAVAAVLETLRAIRAGDPLRNDLIVLFSDGEETGLLGAEAFAAEHPWIADVALVVNLEARGTAGPSMMFQTGPANAAGMRVFAAVNPRPTANSLSDEIYALLPNDTDFTVFAERGIGGFNLAFIENAEHYHTATDDLEHASARSLQHHGIQTLALTRAFGSLDIRDATESGDAVYFDRLGRAVVHYPARLALPIAALAVVLFLTIVSASVHRGMVRLPGVIAGWLVFVAGLAAAYGTVEAGWRLLERISRSSATFDAGLLYRPWPFAGVFAGLAILTMCVAYVLARRHLSSTALALGALLAWIPVMLAVAYRLPGGSYLVTWPVVGTLVVLGALVTLGNPDRRWGTGLVDQPWALLLVLTVAAAPLLLLVPPLVQQVIAALGLGLSSGVMLLAAMGTGLLFPQLEFCWSGSQAVILTPPLDPIAAPQPTHSTDETTGRPGGYEMRALIVYESMFGNAQHVANAIAKGLSTHMSVEAVEVGGAPIVIEPDIDLLVVGSPTHQFRMPRAETRTEAAKHAHAPLVSAGTGTREWLEAVPSPSRPTAAVAFATRLAEPRFLKHIGSVARTIETELRRLGFDIAAPAQSFYVSGRSGPLAEGELDRAEAWGASIAAELLRVLPPNEPRRVRGKEQVTT